MRDNAWLKSGSVKGSIVRDSTFSEVIPANTSLGRFSGQMPSCDAVLNSKRIKSLNNFQATTEPPIRLPSLVKVKSARGSPSEHITNG